MRILVTGNMGYVGPVVVNYLRDAFPGARIIGFDAGYFAHCLTNAICLPETRLDLQIMGDVRVPPAGVLDTVDAVVYLAAISNDAMGQVNPMVTFDVNCHSAVRFARLARRAGAKSFVFASSCSVYGTAEEGARDEASAVSPLTAYAQSKVEAERELASLARSGFNVTCLRFATACGMADRLRLDLVLNDFVASAVATGRVDVLSDGTPWRPLIEVRDMARAITWAVVRPTRAGGTFLVVNAGSNAWNIQVRDLAEAVAREIPGTEVSISADSVPDKRSYRVDFGLFRRLAPDHQPAVDLPAAIRSLRDGLLTMGFKDKTFRQSQLVRLKVLTRFRNDGFLDEALRWTTPRRGLGPRVVSSPSAPRAALRPRQR